jgi:hypothetical protein
MNVKKMIDASKWIEMDDDDIQIAPNHEPSSLTIWVMADRLMSHEV